MTAQTTMSIVRQAMVENYAQLEAQVQDLTRQLAEAHSTNDGLIRENNFLHDHLNKRTKDMQRLQAYAVRLSTRLEHVQDLLIGVARNASDVVAKISMVRKEALEQAAEEEEELKSDAAAPTVAVAPPEPIVPPGPAEEPTGAPEPAEAAGVPQDSTPAPEVPPAAFYAVQGDPGSIIPTQSVPPRDVQITGVQVAGNGGSGGGGPQGGSMITAFQDVEIALDRMRHLPNPWREWP